MSPSLLRSHCGYSFHAYQIHWQGNVLPEGRFRVAVAPLAQVIRRWFNAQNSKSVFRFQMAQNAAYSKNSSPTYPSPSAVLLTLNPERMSLMGQETFNVSHLNRVKIPVFPTYGVGYTSQTPFPPRTKGFFYYHQPPALPPIAGEMRFRICDDASQFANGKDLDVEIGEPWNIPLINIVKVSRYKEILALLLREGLVDQGIVADIENIAGEGKESQKKGITIYDIDQPFVVNSNATALRLRLNTRNRLWIVKFRPFTIFRARNGPQFRPYGGGYLP